MAVGGHGEVNGKKLKKRYIFLREITAICAALVAYSIYTLLIFKKAAPIVEIGTGQISGVVSFSRSGREFYEYRKIPYAEAPIRFQPPQRPKSWTGVRDGSSHMPICIQIDLLTRERLGQEDCLYLTVSVPKIRDELLPVIVFLHGGGFVSGRMDNLGPEFWMDENIVFVTLHYRLSLFGFLNVDDEVRGNMGLKDQVMALRWIQENIMTLGGNPRNVVIVGESAGGSSVHYHMLSPQSKGLFSGGISQSATALLSFTFNKREYNEQRLTALAEQTNCPLPGVNNNNSRAFVNCLRQKDAVELVELQRFLVDPPRNPQRMFLPSIEAVMDSDTFLHDEPINILRKGGYNQVPWITGINSEEGLLFSGELTVHPAQLDSFENDWHKNIPRHLNIPDHNETLTEAIKNFYFSKASSVPLNSMETHLNSYTDMFSDRVFFVSNSIAARIQGQFSPVYLYVYTHVSEISMIEVMKAMRAEGSHHILEFILLLAKNWVYRMFGWNPRFVPGVAHAEEILLQFSALPIPTLQNPSSSPDYMMSSSMIKTWVDFAVDHTTMTFRNASWSPVDPSAKIPLYMNLNLTNGGMKPEPFHTRVKFWENHIGIY